MRSNGAQKLEKVELVLLGISIISLIIGGITGKLIYPVIMLLLTQIVSFLSRLRFQKITRRGLNRLHNRIGNQLQTSTEEIKTEEQTLIIPNSEEQYVVAEITTTKQRTSVGVSTPTYELRYELKEHQETISGLSISSDSRYLVSVSWDQTLRLWETNTGTLLKKINAHSSGVLAVVFLTGQQKLNLATGSFDQKIKLWQIKETTPTGTRQKEIEITLQDTLKDHRGSIQSLAFNPTKQILLSGSYDQTVKQWKMPEGHLIATGYDPSGSIYAVAIDPLGKYFASSGGDGKVLLWELGSKQPLGSLVGNISSVQSLAISSDGQIVAAGCINGQIVLWQIEDSKSPEIRPWRILKGHSGPVKALAFRAISNILFSGSSDGSIYLWQPDKTDPLTQLKDPNQDYQPISSLILSPDGSYLVAGDNSGKIKVWSRG